jgi:hypothetical protein
MKFIRIFIVSILLISCSQTSTDNIRAKYISTLIKKVGIQELPYSFDLTKDQIISKHDINRNSIDTLFFDDWNGLVAGVLPDTSGYYCFLYYSVGDALYPNLVTIDKKGNIIDKANICIGNCAGLMIDIDSCIDKVTINKDLSIDLLYRVRGSVETQDSLHKTVKVNNQIKGKGKILEDGKIEISKGELEIFK